MSTLKVSMRHRDSRAPIERYLRRLVTYLARLQSVIQNSENGLALTCLQAYVKLDPRAWLRMYSRMHHVCDLQACAHLLDPALLVAASLGTDAGDICNKPDIAEELETGTLTAVRDMRNGLAMGGSPDATPLRSEKPRNSVRGL